MAGHERQDATGRDAGLDATAEEARGQELGNLTVHRHKATVRPALEQVGLDCSEERVPIAVPNVFEVEAFGVLSPVQRNSTPVRQKEKRRQVPRRRSDSVGGYGRRTLLDRAVLGVPFPCELATGELEDPQPVFGPFAITGGLRQQLEQLRVVEQSIQVAFPRLGQKHAHVAHAQVGKHSPNVVPCERIKV